MLSYQTFSSIGIRTRGLVTILVSAREYECSNFWTISTYFHSPDGTLDKSLPLFQPVNLFSRLNWHVVGKAEANAAYSAASFHQFGCTILTLLKIHRWYVMEKRWPPILVYTYLRNSSFQWGCILICHMCEKFNYHIHPPAQK